MKLNMLLKLYITLYILKLLDLKHVTFLALAEHDFGWLKKKQFLLFTMDILAKFKLKHVQFFGFGRA